MTTRFEKPKTPVLLDEAFSDPNSVRAMVEANAPYWPVLRYVAKPSEFAAVSRAKSQDPMILPPWFRGDWADRKPLVQGGEVIVENPQFIDAARTVFDAEIAVPCLVYVNVMAPLPFAGEGHIDVPAFRGIDRSEYPIWLLQQMVRSGLFESWQIDIATAVSWFYAGEGGAFDYWADGPGKAPSRVEQPMDNRAVVGDNDFMFHRVDAIGANAKMVEASLDAELKPDGKGAWTLEDEGEVIERYSGESLRVSVSWKAEMFRDEEARRIRADHSDDLDLDWVIDRFVEDLEDRGSRIVRPSQPLADSEFMDALSSIYTLPDLVYPTAKETDLRAS
ncbi:MAG: hypothetical protein AB8G23_12465 [Myxococcota bacterium]